MLVLLAKGLIFFQKSFAGLQRFGLNRYPLLLMIMLCFALNRYGVASINTERRDLQSRVAFLQEELKGLQQRNDKLRKEVEYFEDPRWQEMVIMRHLLLFADNVKVYWFTMDEHKESTES